MSPTGHLLRRYVQLIFFTRPIDTHLFPPEVSQAQWRGGHQR